MNKHSNPLLPIRRFYGGGMAFCWFILLYGMYLQFYAEMPPCSLCILQRLVWFALAIIFNMALITPGLYRRQQIYHRLILALCLVGAGLASWQLWLTYQPSGLMSNCVAGVPYLLYHVPLLDTILSLFRSEGDCGHAVASWLGISLPLWSLAAFIFCGVMTGLRAHFLR